MPDINLLKDTPQTERESEKKPKRVPPVPVEYSLPEEAEEKLRPLKKPSAFGLWIRSLFRARGKKKQEPSPPPPPPRPREPVPAKSKLRPAEPKDIFSDIPIAPGGPTAKVLTGKPEPPAPRGPRPGEFPPLPSMPPPIPSSPVPPPPPGSPGEAWRAGRPPPRPVPPPPPIPPRRKINIPAFIPPRRPERPSAEEIGGVNLLPEELLAPFDPRKKLITVGLLALSVALAVGIIDVSLLLWKETQVRKTEDKRAQVALTIQRIKELEKEQRAAILLKSSNELIRQRLNQHVYWTKFLAAFEKYTLPTISYPSGFSGDINSTSLSLSGVAPDIETIVEQLAAYQQATDFIKDVKIEAINRLEQGAGYGFTADLTFLPGVYYDPFDKTGATPETETSTNTNQSAP